MLARATLNLKHRSREMQNLNTISLAELFETAATAYPESVYRVESIELGDKDTEWVWMGEAKIIPFGHKDQALYVDESDGYKIVDLKDFDTTVRFVQVVNYFADGEWSDGAPIEFDESFETEAGAFDDAVSRFTGLTEREQSRVRWIGVRKSDGETTEPARLINPDTLEWAD